MGEVCHTVPGSGFLDGSLCWPQPIPGPLLIRMCPRAAPESPVTFWYQVTVLVKMDFKELEAVDPRLLDHMRLLHSMVGGEDRGLVRAPLQGRLPGLTPGEALGGNRGLGWGVPQVTPIWLTLN